MKIRLGNKSSLSLRSDQRERSAVRVVRLSILTWIRAMAWYQSRLTLPAFRRGFHLVTSHVVNHCPQLATIRVGLLHVFIQHTSASLSINENADPDVPRDLESSFNAIAPENFPYIHTCEGPDDMPAHVKSSLLGASLMIPISQGRLCLGTWQGIYLCEHRNHGGQRSLVLTIQGDSTDAA